MTTVRDIAASATTKEIADAIEIAFLRLPSEVRSPLTSRLPDMHQALLLARQYITAVPELSKLDGDAVVAAIDAALGE